MNCRVLHILNPRHGGASPIMPVDMAVRICLASSPPLRSFLGNYDNRCSSSAAALLPRCQPLRPCLASGRCSDALTGGSSSSSIAMATAAATSAAAAESSGQAWLRKKTKKSVVFADSQGLALTAVHVFDEAEDDLLSELQFHLTELEGAAGRLQLDATDPADGGLVLVLDFTQPAADYLDLRNRLKAQQVCLETCSVQDRLLSGTVQVRNICFEKSVSVRITFDSWRSFRDVPCRYLNNVYGCPDIDTFDFSVAVPELLRPADSTEFCVQYQTRDRTYWDNNLGNNYRLAVTDPHGSPTRIPEGTAGVQRDGGSGGGEEERQFDPLGSPRTAAGIFSEWQSWGRVETGAPYW